jgi:hypothetical protein
LSESSHEAGRGPAHRSAEIGIAAITALFGIIIMYGSYAVGIDWGVEGPRSGFFPFYVGLIIVACSAVNLVQAAMAASDGQLFADWGQLRSVMSVVIPTAIYVFVLPYLGIYVSSMILIGGFMIWLGKYGWAKSLAIAMGVPVVTYVMFEKWFLVPLPKGPIEYWLGL